MTTEEYRKAVAHWVMGRAIILIEQYTMSPEGNVNDELREAKRLLEAAEELLSEEIFGA